MTPIFQRCKQLSDLIEYSQDNGLVQHVKGHYSLIGVLQKLIAKCNNLNLIDSYLLCRLLLTRLTNYLEIVAFFFAKYEIGRCYPINIPESNELENNMALIQLTRLMVDMVRHLSREAGKKLSGDITLGQFLFLRTIDAGINKVSNLAEKMRITPAAASKMADSLVEADLLDRVRSEDDKRIYTLTLTSYGKDLLRQNIVRLKDVMDKSFEILSEEEINDLLRIFTKVLSQYDLMDSAKPVGKGKG